MPKHSFSKILTLVLFALCVILSLVLLAIWTSSINERDKAEKLKAELEKVVSEGGESALLKSAGINVNGIFHADDGVILFEGDGNEWKYSADEMQNISVFRKAAPSVVEIVSDDTLVGAISGCGIIISSEGHVITNGHVIGSGSTFTANLYDGSQEEADLIGVDTVTDIAVIKLKGEGKPYAPLSFDTSPLTVGQKVLAIGSPYGYSWSQSVGTVSSLGRIVTGQTGLPLANMIQTDVQLNPGNSGGPLLSAHGMVVGVNTAIISTSGQSQGMSFALSSETVLSVASDLVSKGRVDRGWLDILSVENNSQISEYLKLGVSDGVIVSQVVPGGKADKGGLRGGSERVQYGSSVIYLGGDVITGIGDEKVKGYNDYFRILLSTKAGEKKDITVYRGGAYVTLKGVELALQTEENAGWIIR